jgi:glycosyltransferase involved in cell wall biosynthesis
MAQAFARSAADELLYGGAKPSLGYANVFAGLHLHMSRASLTIAWISDFPVEWLADLPAGLRHLRREHPATWQLVLLEEFQKRADLDLHIILLRKHISHDVTFTSKNVTFHLLKVPPASRAPSLFWVDTLLIRRALKNIRPDLIHAWGTERGAGLIASRLPYPYLITIQGLLTWYRQLVPLSRYEQFAARLETVSLNRCRLVTAESSFAVQFLGERFPHLAIRQAEHAPNRLFHCVERKPQTSPIRFITVGTLGFRKGSDLLLKAFHTLAAEMPFEVTVIGSMSDSYLHSHEALLGGRMDGRLTVKTNLVPAEVALEMEQATILVLPTRADTSPNAVKEAVVAGVPVVASAIGGIVDYVVPDKNGLLFQATNLDQLIASLKMAVRHPLFSHGRVDPETLKEMRSYLSPSRMAERFLSSYEEVLR